MTALTTDRQTKERVLNGTNLPVAANTRIWAGSLVALNATGFLVPVTNTGSASTLRVIGRAAEHVDNRTAVGPGLDGSLSCLVEYGVFQWGNSGGGDEIALDDLGAVAYGQDDQTVALTSDGGDRPAVGVIVDVDDAGVWVWHNPIFLTIGDGDLVAANNLSDVANAATARGNLGIISHLTIPRVDLVGATGAVYRYVHSGPNATIQHIRTAITGALTVGDATITASINGTPVTNGVVTITQAGSAEGDVDVASPTAANVIAEGQVLELTVGGTNTATEFADLSVEISY